MQTDTQTTNDPRTPDGIGVGSSPLLGSVSFLKLRPMLAELLWYSVPEITLTARLREDLHADSLDMVELMFIIEGNWPVIREVTEEDVIVCQTVADVVALIDRLVLPNTMMSEPLESSSKPQSLRSRDR